MPQQKQPSKTNKELSITEKTKKLSLTEKKQKSLLDIQNE